MFKQEKRAGKAQASGTGAAVLILLIAVLIVIYILFLPPQTREDLLNEPTPGGNQLYSAQQLLIESPGRIEYVTTGIIEHTVPSVNLFSTTEAIVVKTLQSVYAKNAWMDKKPYNFSFSLDSVEGTQNVIMTFNVKQRSGRLLIKLNGYEIYNNEVATINIEPIRLPKEVLKETNMISFEVSEVGWKFWNTNEYTLENLKITAEVTDLTTQESKSIFHVSATEKNNVETTSLVFTPECYQEKIGVLEIFLNNHNIFTAVPDCGLKRSIEIAPEYLIGGENSLLFSTKKGVYVIDNVQIKTKMKEITFPAYYFEMNNNQYDAVAKGGAKVTLKLEFANDIDQKTADLFINGHAKRFNTKDKEYSTEITLFVNKGNNVIEIKPRATMDIVNLKVTLE